MEGWAIGLLVIVLVFLAGYAAALPGKGQDDEDGLGPYTS